MEVGYKQGHGEWHALKRAEEDFTAGVAALMSWFSMDVHRKGRDFDHLFVTSFVIPRIRHRLHTSQYKDVKSIELPPNIRRRFSLGPSLLKNLPKVANAETSKALTASVTNQDLITDSVHQPIDDETNDSNDENNNIDEYGTASEFLNSHAQLDNSASPSMASELLRAAKQTASAEVGTAMLDLSTVCQTS